VAGTTSDQTPVDDKVEEAVSAHGSRDSRDPDPQDGDGPADDDSTRFGTPGKPINRNGPFYWGFVGAIGVLVAMGLVDMLGKLSQILTLIAVAAFIAIGLDPLVRMLQRRGLRRSWAVTVVFLGLILVVAAFIAAIVPTLVSQAGQLVNNLPGQVDDLRKTEWLSKLDQDYGVIENASNQLQQRLKNGDTWFSLFGGILGAGRAVVSGFFSVISVLVLTLYFLASLRGIAESCYRLAPSSRRERVKLLGDEIIRRIGGYVAGQVGVATINGVLTFFLCLILGLPYSALLAITVGLLGLIPLVGATIGAVVVVLVGLFQSATVAIVIAVYYIIYQQVENYVIAPRIMSRTVAVPGAIALIAALAGGALLGVLGALLAIPVAAAILLVVQEVLIPRQDRV